MAKILQWDYTNFNKYFLNIFKCYEVANLLNGMPS